MHNELYDALFERFIIWALGGNLIKTIECLKSIDHHRYPTLQQFSLISSFIENATFEFVADAEMAITEWADEIKEQGKEPSLRLLWSRAHPRYCSP